MPSAYDPIPLRIGYLGWEFTIRVFRTGPLPVLGHRETWGASISVFAPVSDNPMVEQPLQEVLLEDGHPLASTPELAKQYARVVCHRMADLYQHFAPGAPDAPFLGPEAIAHLRTV